MLLVSEGPWAKGQGGLGGHTGMAQWSIRGGFFHAWGDSPSVSGICCAPVVGAAMGFSIRPFTKTQPVFPVCPS